MNQIAQRLLEIFTTITKIDGTSGQERDVADYIKNFLTKVGFEIYEDQAGSRIGGNSGNLICKIGTGGDYVLLSHMDTARPTKNLEHKIEDDRISSKGGTILGADNRAGIASILFNLERAHNQRIPLKDFTVVFTISEENNLEGSKALQLDEKISSGFIIDSSLRPGKFIYSTYGATGLDITIKGKAAHSGLQPEDGISSIQVASRAIADLKLGRIDGDTTANLGKINGGSAINVIPEVTNIVGEIRGLTKEKVEETANHFKKQFEKSCNAAGAQLDFKYHWDFEPYKIDPDSRVYRELVGIYHRLGLDPEPVVSAGGSDANSLNAKGIEALNIGIGAQNPHSNDEFILFKDLNTTADIIYELIRK